MIDWINWNKRQGTYWGIATNIDKYKDDKKIKETLYKHNASVELISYLRTRLNKFNEAEQYYLINLGYALADTAMRRYVLEKGEPMGALPYPDFPLDDVDPNLGKPLWKKMLDKVYK